MVLNTPWIKKSIYRRRKMANLIKITFQASPTSSPATRIVESGRTIQEYLEDVEGITSFNNITVLVDGEPMYLSEDIEDGMSISITHKKTDSGF
jgi:hypothetical protein